MSMIGRRRLRLQSDAGLYIWIRELSAISLQLLEFAAESETSALVAVLPLISGGRVHPRTVRSKPTELGVACCRPNRVCSTQATNSNTREYEMNTEHPIRVLSIDDHPLLSEGIATMINNEPDMQLVATASTATDGIAKYREVRPDVTLMDLRLPDTSGIEALIAIRSEFPDARIILLTMFAGDVEIQRALQAGAQAYLLKSMDPEQMITTIRQVHSGKKRVPPEIASELAEHMGDEQLTDRELEV